MLHLPGRGAPLGASPSAKPASPSWRCRLLPTTFVYGSWAVATAWNPPGQRKARKIATNGTLGLGIKAASSVLREFWPGVKTQMHRH